MARASARGAAEAVQRGGAGTEGPGGAGVEAEVWRRRREWPRTHNPISVPHDRAKTGARLTPREPTGFIARVVPRDAVDGRCDSERDCGRVGAAVSQRCDTKGGQGVAGACRNRTYQGPFGPQLVLKTSRTTRPDPPPCTNARRPRHPSEAGHPGITPVTCLPRPAHTSWTAMVAAPRTVLTGTPAP